MNTLERFILSDFIGKLYSFKTVAVLFAIYVTLQLAGLIVGMI
jgi:hypothetical protein